MPSARKILICPLDWGLGHATRCIPIVRALEKRGAEVFIASSGPALALLKIEFSSNKFFNLPSYDPKYAHGRSLVGMILSQLPKFRKIVNDEHTATEDIVQQHAIDAVISDNRYGCWAKGIDSVFITHQPNVIMPSGYGWVAPGINWVLQQQIKKFSRVWIPDQFGSGLTDPFYSKVVADQRYIGWLSRFEHSSAATARYAVIAIVSGPEPQRTIFENVIKRELKATKLKSLIVSGQPGPSVTNEEGNVTTVNHLPAPELQRAIVDSAIVVCRSGYSSIMDLIALKKNAIFIPTPGQPEQTVLARYLDKQGHVMAQQQNKFDLADAIDKSASYTGLTGFNMDERFLTTALDSFLR
jgi:uncharacterized protein (TIGR00661 family)